MISFHLRQKSCPNLPGQIREGANKPLCWHWQNSENKKSHICWQVSSAAFCAKRFSIAVWNSDSCMGVQVWGRLKPNHTHFPAGRTSVKGKNPQQVPIKTVAGLCYGKLYQLQWLPGSWGLMWSLTLMFKTPYALKLLNHHHLTPLSPLCLLTLGATSQYGAVPAYWNINLGHRGLGAFSCRVSRESAVLRD